MLPLSVQSSDSFFVSPARGFRAHLSSGATDQKHGGGPVYRSAHSPLLQTTFSQSLSRMVYGPVFSRALAEAMEGMER